MKGYTWVVTSVVLGIVHGKSSKQKINTKSSIETELVGVSDYIPWTICAKIFLMGQGYNLKRNNFIKITKVP